MDSLMSPPSGYAGSGRGANGWGAEAGLVGGRRRVSQMSHRKASASLRPFGFGVGNDTRDADGHGIGRGGWDGAGAGRPLTPEP